MSLLMSGVADDAFGQPEEGAGSVGAVVLTEKEEGMTHVVLPKEEEKQALVTADRRRRWPLKKIQRDKY